MSLDLPKDDRTAAPAGSVPLEMLERALRQGWLLVTLVLLGSLAGWAAYRLQPPLYEARFGFTVAFDLSNMGEMTQFEQDFTSGAVGDLIFSSDLREAVAAQAREKGVQVSAEDLKVIATRERQAQTWYVRIRHASAPTAALLGELWGQAADQAIRSAYAQGVVAQGLQRYLESLEDCLARAALIDPAGWDCSAENLPAIQKELKTTGLALAEAKLASRGVLPSLVISWTEKASLPRQPALLGQGKRVLAGAFLGFVLAVILIETGLSGRVFQRKPRG